MKLAKGNSLTQFRIDPYNLIILQYKATLFIGASWCIEVRLLIVDQNKAN